MSEQKKNPLNHISGKRLIKNLVGVSVLSLSVLTGVTGCRGNERISNNDTAKVPQAVSMKLLSVKTSDSGSEGSGQSKLPKKSKEETDKKKADQLNREQSDLLVLVNKDHPLSEDYDVKMKTLDHSDKVAAEVIIQDLQNMLADGTGEGLRFCIASAYRSAERQQEILDQDIKKLTDKGMTEEEAYIQATKTVMPAGYSEHETGLAVDIVALSNQLLDDSQENTPETQWLHDNCDQYGFILRYPKEKTEITGIDYESWHYRYVGKEAAAYMKKHDLTFEEYLEEKVEPTDRKLSSPSLRMFPISINI